MDGRALFRPCGTGAGRPGRVRRRTGQGRSARTAGLPASGSEATVGGRVRGDGAGATAAVARLASRSVAARRGVGAGSVRFRPEARADGSGPGHEMAEEGTAPTARRGAPERIKDNA